MPAVSKFLIQSLRQGIKDPMHALDFGLLAGSTIALAESASPTPATMENLLCKALATTEPNEICFVHFPPEEISFSPEAQEHIDKCTFSIPAIETDCDGLVFFFPGHERLPPTIIQYKTFVKFTHITS